MLKIDRELGADGVDAATDTRGAVNFYQERQASQLEAEGFSDIPYGVRAGMEDMTRAYMSTTGAPDEIEEGLVLDEEVPVEVI